MITKRIAIIGLLILGGALAICFFARILPLSVAVWTGTPLVAKFQLILGADVNSGFEGRTPLMEACIAGRSDWVELLVSNEADVNQKDAHSVTALMSASARGCLRCVEVLLNAGVSVNDTDDVGRTALTLAVMNDKVDVLATLINAGSDPNIAMKDGITPLMLAVKHHDNQMVSLLLSSGASYGAVSHSNKTAADFAIEIGDLPTRTAILDQLEHSKR